MEVDCEGCAGCCIDWRDLAPGMDDPEHGGNRRPIDDAYNLVPLERDELRALIEAGYGDALTPRLWTVEGDAADVPDVATIDGYDLAAIDGRPVFYVGLRKPPKPVTPFGVDEATWLPACVFLDPTTLQCRIHGDDLYPSACEAYPGYNLSLDQETECERVEAVHGGQRLLDDEPPADLPGLQLGPQALGAKLFVYPDPGDLEGRIERIADGAPIAEDRAAFAGAAAGASPGTTAVDDDHRDRARERVLEADSWVGRAIEEWTDRAAEGGADPSLAERVEDDRGAPGTPGWE